MAQNTQLTTVDSLKKMTASGTAYTRRFEEVLGKKANKFLASVISVTSGNSMLSKADPTSILQSAMVSATLDLEVVPTFGFAAIVPYKNRDGNTYAQFQIMTRGLVQLAMRTGEYEIINSGIIYEDEIDGVDLLTGKPRLHDGRMGYRKADNFGNSLEDLRNAHVAGFFAYFKTLTGYERTEYWDLGRIYNHALRYSQSFSYDMKNNRRSSNWSTDFRAMANKTVLKNMLSKWGILSTTLQDAIIADQKVYDGVNSEGSYADNEPQQDERNVTPSDANSGAVGDSYDPADELMPHTENNAGFDPFV